MELVKRLGMVALVVLVASVAGAQVRSIRPRAAPAWPPPTPSRKSRSNSTRLAGISCRSAWYPGSGSARSPTSTTSSPGPQHPDKVSDFTATAGAGLTAYLPTGSNVYWIAQAQPGTSGGRTTSTVATRRPVRRRRLRLLQPSRAAGHRRPHRGGEGVGSWEIPQLAIARQERAAVNVDLRLTGKFYGGAPAGPLVAHPQQHRPGVDDPADAPFVSGSTVTSGCCGAASSYPSRKPSAAGSASAPSASSSDSAAGARDLSIRRHLAHPSEVRTEKGNRVVRSTCTWRCAPSIRWATRTSLLIDRSGPATPVPPSTPCWAPTIKLYGRAGNPGLTRCSTTTPTSTSVDRGRPWSAAPGARRLRVRCCSPSRGRTATRALSDSGVPARTDDTRSVGAQIGLEVSPARWGFQIGAVHSEIDCAGWPPGGEPRRHQHPNRRPVGVHRPPAVALSRTSRGERRRWAASVGTAAGRPRPGQSPAASPALAGASRPLQARHSTNPGRILANMV